jgi:hypothetical protein
MDGNELVTNALAKYATIQIMMVVQQADFVVDAWPCLVVAVVRIEECCNNITAGYRLCVNAASVLKASQKVT